ncbi:hypothetical protein KY363_02055 [Candidatus Woesearchaeota archaeon]|nr:hypothetical protein [Candidatus Woesearchaeota archaeon]
MRESIDSLVKDVKVRVALTGTRAGQVIHYEPQTPFVEAMSVAMATGARIVEYDGHRYKLVDDRAVADNGSSYKENTYRRR